MPAIITDIDGTILDMGKISEALAKELGFSSAEELDKRWDSMQEKEREDAVVVWHRLAMDSDPDEIEGAKVALNRLKDEGYEIYYITGREPVTISGRGMKNILEGWLDRHGFPKGELHVVGWHKCGETKMKVIEKIVSRVKKPIYGIGDRKPDMFAYAVHGVIPVLIHNHKYHKYYKEEARLKMEGLVRVESWEQFIQFLEKNPSVDFVVGGFIEKDGKVLLVKHKQIGKWLPPGGHIEKWEAPDDAVIREMKEETGLDVEFLDRPELEGEMHRPDIVHRHRIHFGHDHIMFGYFLSARGEFKGNDEGEWHWFSKEELKKGERDGVAIPEHVAEMCMRRLELNS